MSTETQIAAPAAKAASAIGAGVGTSVLSTITANPASFLPTSAEGWMALGASTIALLYSLCLLSEWCWKRIFRPIAVRFEWLPKAKGTSFQVDGDGNVTRIEAP